MKQKPPSSPPERTTPLPVTPARVESSRGVLENLFASRGPVSTLHFLVHGDLPEVRRDAEARGWLARGFTHLTIPWLELHWTADGWKTKHVVSSNDVPCPIVNGTFHLSGCAAGTDVDFAIHVGVACHAPGDSAFARDVGDLWLNNAGQNYRQVTK